MVHLLFLFPVLLLLAGADASAAPCSKASCGGHDIRYPFWPLTGSTSDYYCGYPGLGLACEANATLILPIQSHSYRVLSVDYANRTVSVADADADDGAGSCPRLRANLTVDAASAWLQLTPADSDVTFLYDCNNMSWLLELSGCQQQGGGGSKHSYLLPNGGLTGTEARDYECEAVVVAPVLGANAAGILPLTDGSVGAAVRAGFELVYDARSQQCRGCERSGGWCRYRRRNGTDDGGMGFACFCEDGGDQTTADYCGHKKRTKIHVVASTSCLLVLCLLIAAFFLARKYGLLSVKLKHEPRIESFLQNNGNLHPKRYTYAEVKRMTNYFAVKLGQGGFGAVYRGNFSDGRQVAVKILKASKGDGEEFMNEVASISRTSHVNVVTLLGFCLQRSKRALIYEYMPNGSLERYAFNSNMKTENTLTWEKLFDIAVGIARGLEYLHRGCNTRIVHFDIKPHNILLDQDFCPKISDFGLAKLCLNKESIVSIHGARGTIGYIAPEVYSKQFGTISSKSDVYSYGMMVLEMVGARETDVNANSESSSQFFPQWIYEHLDEYCMSASEINEETSELVRKMIVVGMWCVQLTPTNRPTMTRVLEMLEGSISNLDMPPKELLS